MQGFDLSAAWTKILAKIPWKNSKKLASFENNMTNNFSRSSESGALKFFFLIKFTKDDLIKEH